MYSALDVGISARDFWDMSLRAVFNITWQMRRVQEAAALRQAQRLARSTPAAPTGDTRLARLPRP